MILEQGICSATIHPRNGYSALDIKNLLEGKEEVRNVVLLDDGKVSVAFWFILTSEQFNAMSSHLLKFGHITGQHPQGLDV